MKVIAFITTSQQNVIHKIIEHLGENAELPKATGPSLWLQILQAKEHVHLFQDWYPDEQGDWAA